MVLLAWSSWHSYSSYTNIKCVLYYCGSSRIPRVVCSDHVELCQSTHVLGIKFLAGTFVQDICARHYCKTYWSSSSIVYNYKFRGMNFLQTS